MHGRFQAPRLSPLAGGILLGVMVHGTLLLSPVGTTQAGTPEEAGPKSLRLVPEDVALVGRGAAQQVVLLGEFADGMERDLTRQSQLLMSSSGVATVDASGRVHGVADGRCVITATYAGLSAISEIAVSCSDKEQPFRFSRDICTILTKRGCNSTDCHGSVPGKGGFKLSSNALHPRDDFEWIVQGGTYEVLTEEVTEPRMPRVDLEQPQKSLLLLKATLQVDHDGGELLEVDSADYRTILRWIQNGTPYEDAGVTKDTEIDHIEVYPPMAVLDRQGHRQMLVSAFFSDGSRGDLTGEVAYETTTPNVVEVTQEGWMEGVGFGETVVVVRAAGHVATARVAVVAPSLDNYPDLKLSNLIDEHVFAKLKKLHIKPAGLCTDVDFLRRLCLDLTGTLPPPARVRQFLTNDDARKRETLTEALLASPEFIDYWTFRFSDLFRVDYNARQNVKSTQMYQEWVRDCVATNKPYDQIALERIAAQGNAAPTQNYYFMGNRTPQEIAAEQARVFLGVRLDCAQCHDHPYETWSQDQFWGLTAFFSTITSMPNETMGSALILDDIHRQAVHPRTKKKVQPTYLDGQALAANDEDPRGRLVAWITSEENPFFARAAVNRMWSYFFGRGIVDPVDDFRTTNPPTHPKLLDALAADFRDHEYDLKHLIRRIVSSRTYQLSGQVNATNGDDHLNYSRSLPRPLDAEILLDAISQVTGVDERFSAVGHPLAPRGVEAAAPPGTRAIDLVPQLYPSSFLEMYGRHGRATVKDRQNQPSLAQALHMYAGSTYMPKISTEDGRVDGLLTGGASDREIIEELYLRALSRLPTSEEATQLETMIQQHESRRQAVEMFTWALLTSREFAYNR